MYQPYLGAVNISKLELVCLNYVFICHHIDCVLKLEDGIGPTKYQFLKEYVMYAQL